MVSATNREDVIGFLKANDFEVTDMGDRIYGDHVSSGKKTSIWLPNTTNDRNAIMEELRRFGATPGVDDGIVLVPTMTSFGTEFLKLATKLHLQVRTFNFYLDGPFVQNINNAKQKPKLSAQSGRRAANFFRKYRRPELLSGVLDVNLRTVGDMPTWRVPQPYAVNGRAGHDLLVQLIHDATSMQTRPRLTLVTGAAGSGKSILFSGFFTWLYDRFHNTKPQSGRAVRPLPIVPDDLVLNEGYSTEELMEAVGQSSGVRPVGKALLAWMITSGRASLLFDGIDEFLAGHRSFFREIQKVYLQDGQADIYMFFRDSLLATNEPLSEMLAELRLKSQVDVREYRLSSWDEAPASDSDPRRALVWLRVEGRLPERGERETQETSKILQYLAKEDNWELAALPFFCEFLIKRAQVDPNGDKSGDRFDLLEDVLQRLVEREWDKLALSRHAYGVAAEDAFISSGRLSKLNDWIGTSSWLSRFRLKTTQQGRRTRLTDPKFALVQALNDVRRRLGANGIYSVLEHVAFDHQTSMSADGNPSWVLKNDYLFAMYKKYVPDANANAHDFAERVLRQFALFGEGEFGLTFAHPILAEFLAARFVVGALKSGKSHVHAMIDRPPPQSSVFFDYIAREVRNDKSLRALLEAQQSNKELSGRARENLAAILALRTND